MRRLGLAMLPQRARLRGRSFDRTRARAVVLRRDPRMLVASEVTIDSDLFIGIVVDCSGSMQVGTSMNKAHRFGVLIAEAVRPLHGVDARFFGFTDRVIYDAGDARSCAVTSLKAGGGNNDAAALYHVAKIAAASRRRAKLLVMISDGLPTECSVAALRNLVDDLTRRRGMCCAQVAVRPLAEICFPHHIVLDQDDIEASTRRFGEVVSRLVGRAIGR
jgi:nitric oxide reductase activation protein